jgi:hypothetical protein
MRFPFFRVLPPALLLWTTLAATGAELTPEEFQRLHRDVQPAKEAWTTIPWQSSLIPGQQRALAEGKPLFIWAMDGHPMGCT